MKFTAVTLALTLALALCPRPLPAGTIDGNDLFTRFLYFHAMETGDGEVIGAVRTLGEKGFLPMLFQAVAETTDPTVKAAVDIARQKATARAFLDGYPWPHAFAYEGCQILCNDYTVGKTNAYVKAKVFLSVKTTGEKRMVEVQVKINPSTLETDPWSFPAGY